MMSDTLKNLDQVYAKWEKRGPPQERTGQLANRIIHEGKQRWRNKFGDSVRPVAHRKTRQRRRVTALSAETVSTNVIAQFKTTPTITPESLTVVRPFMGQCCSCLPDSKKDFLTSTTSSAGMKDIFNVKSELKGDSWLERHFSVSMYTLRKTVFRKYADVDNAVLKSTRVLEAVDQQKLQVSITSDKKIQTIEKKPQSILEVMKASISNYLIKITGWFLLKFLPLFLHSVQVHRGQIDMVRKAFERGLPLIYLPLHRSHLDYILVTFILCIQDMKAPYVAAGDNLNIPVFRSLMRGLGGFSIRRKLDRQNGQKDVIYRAVLHSYMQELLKSGESLEFFIEGGRSRSGKTYTPKAGLLSIVVQTLTEGLMEDAYIVPISISYEKILDGNFNKEQMGTPKVKESFWGTIKAIWRVFNGDFGSVRVDFAQPFSLKEYIDSNQPKSSPSPPLLPSGSPTGSVNGSDQDQSSDETPPSTPIRSSGSCSSLYGTDVVVEDQRQLIKSLAEHVAYTSTHCTALMCTNVLAFLLLNKYREGVNMKKLVLDYAWLQDELKARKRDVGFCGTTDEVVNYACALLGPQLVKRKTIKDKNEDTMVSPMISLPEVFELSYYANSVVSVFLLESIVVCSSIYNCDVNLFHYNGLPNMDTCSATREDIIQTALQLCQLFKYEFIFVSPCLNLEVILADTLDQLVTTEILQVQDSQGDVYGSYGNRDPKWAKRISASLSWADEDELGYQDQIVEQFLQVNVQRKDCMDKMLFLYRVLAPFIEAYLVTGSYIYKHLISELPEEDFLKSLHTSAKDRVFTGIASYGESAAVDTLKNAVKAYQDFKIIDIYYAGNMRMVELHDHFEVKDKLNYLISLLEVLRD